MAYQQSATYDDYPGNDLDIIRGDHRSDVRLRQTGRRTSANSTIRGQDQGQANEEVAEGTLYYKQKATTFISHSAPHLGNTTACYQGGESKRPQEHRKLEASGWAPSRRTQDPRSVLRTTRTIPTIHRLRYEKSEGHAEGVC
ncbi:uncharacterized protein LOC119160900 isoform X2 [Rhipicephalus microplus]|uniref:uncharacterized protein LOC119160900 isoform X2 n=1 Tax=Rhipicephalus microplus TaxID=6941 RepID=UPI001887693A|nr:uncharacterized protein LOC119160900 isoform X1 [Rhipicephalus microplus]